MPGSKERHLLFTCKVACVVFLIDRNPESDFQSFSCDFSNVKKKKDKVQFWSYYIFQFKYLPKKVPTPKNTIIRELWPVIMKFLIDVCGLFICVSQNSTL